MDQIFIELIKSLAKNLSLDPPAEIENPVSLTIDDRWMVYIGLFNEKDLVMFVGFDPISDKARLRTLLRDNLFSAIQDRPRVGMTSDSRILLWAQIPIMDANPDRTHKALLRLAERVRDFQDWLDAPLKEDGEDDQPGAGRESGAEDSSNGSGGSGGELFGSDFMGIRV